ncbi:ABC transporter substrate-binding protein [Cohnella mopanensis]|uniref:ABC transporter substrate-binding protein n=1 Tax=Cohnella mopanensis TaxID=2911966 RepID=UPI001EF97028|nr:extracellular solute-binding protein [Cohnella mopanensis]
MKRSKLFLFAIMLLLTWTLAACGSNNTNEASTSSSASPNAPASGDKVDGKQVTLNVMTNINDQQAKVLEDIARAFEQENPNIKVEFTAPGAEYENIMKVKMASNSMPDVFSTHGWSKIRYADYLTDLKDEAWVSQIDDAIKPAVTDDAGKVYVLPMDQDKSGPVYNAEVLEKYGVEVPKTWDELMQAAETIKTKSNGKVTAFHIGGADTWPIGQFFDFFATPAFISAADNNASQFLDGTFDWTKFDKLPQMFLELQQKGYLNKDVLTAKYSDSAKAFAEGKVAFGIYGPFLIDEAQKINPNLKGGLMPIPSIAAGDQPTLAGGERSTWGVWKDSPNIDAAKKFVAFYAKPENIAKVATSEILPPGLKGVNIDAGDLTDDFEQYKDLRVIPYFDRVYLPNGMWDVMCKNGQDLLAGGIKVSEFSENMKQEYERLRAAQQ